MRTSVKAAAGAAALAGAGIAVATIGASSAASHASAPKSTPMKHAAATATPAVPAPVPPQTVTASLITATPNTLPRGTKVRSRTLGERVFPTRRRGFALASVGQAQYPARTKNAGKSWHIDGPALHVNAAQAPLSVTDVGATTKRIAFFYGTGQVVDVTTDGGKQWWRAILGSVVMAVVPGPMGSLVAFAQQPLTNGTSEAVTWVYVSKDGGRQWHFDNSLGALSIRFEKPSQALSARPRLIRVRQSTTRQRHRAAVAVRRRHRRA
jgi:hypothetical protein